MKPTSCNRCGEKKSFSRRLFEISGVADDQYCDDQIQQSIQQYFRRRYSIDCVIFKTHEGQFLADSATCGECRATAIMYDIEWSKDLCSKLSKLVGKSETQIENEMKMIVEMLKQQEQKAATDKATNVEANNGNNYATRE